MPTRSLAALILAPLTAAIVYVLLVVATTMQVPAEYRPEPITNLVFASLIGFGFEVIVLLPMGSFLGGRPRFRVWLLLAGCTVWFAFSLGLFVVLGLAWDSALSTAIQMAVPGVVLVGMFATLFGNAQHA